ncbi:hypothetical protein MMARJ_10950 [Mycobacterium marseillense]|uniref:Uncharacterized protein n=1 Tax=Mycobacterium marseillense TaxID=701042 RepID=A0ABM7J971_9MYCO|nr:hypothetical protein MMARJ_10950 [Mycobacterium marseillense]
MDGAAPGLVGRQVEIGQRRGGPVAGGDENRTESAGSGAPRDGDVISDALTEAVQFFGDGGIGAGVGLGQRVGQGQPLGQCGLDADIGDQSCARDVGDADGGGTLRGQILAQAAQAVALRPRQRALVGHRPHGRGGLVDGDVVAVLVQFVVGHAAFDADIQADGLRARAGPGGEKFRRQEQFGLAEHGVADALADLGRVGGVAARQRNRGLERALQGVVTDVTDEDRAAGGQQLHGLVDDLGQVTRIGEVLDDRVENDGVEVALRQPVGDVGGLGQQLDAVAPRQLQLFHRAGQVVDRDGREVGGDVLIAVRGDL